MNRGGHLLASFQIASSSTNIQTTAYAALTTAAAGAGRGSAVMVFNGGAQPIGLYSQSDGSGGQICTIPPSGYPIYIPTIVPNTPLYLKSLGSAQSSGLISVDVYG